MPLVPLLIAGFGLFLLAGKKKPAPMAAPAPRLTATSPLPPPGAGPLLDSNIPPETAQAVRTALATETEPRALRAFAARLRDAQFPVAATLLETRAMQVASAQPVSSAAGGMYA